MLENRVPAREQGFTLVELAIVIAMMIVIALFTVPNLFGHRSKNALDGTVQEIAVTLREAQSRSISEASSTIWGVHFEYNSTASFYALFPGNTYALSNSAGYNRLPSGIEYVTSTLVGGVSKDVVFTSLDGATASTSIQLYIVGGNLSSTISIASSGVVTY